VINTIKSFTDKKSKFWIILISTLCFIAAFIFAKGLIGFARFIIIHYFGGSFHLDNFDLVCVEHANSSIWTHKSVISIYSIGLLAALFMALVSFVFYKWTKNQKGIVNLWFLWLYVIALNQALGKLFVDVILKRDFYHALNWMYIPYQFMYVIAAPSIVLLSIVISYNRKRFIRIATSQKGIKSKKFHHNKYTYISLVPAIIGTALLLMSHVTNIHRFEVFEMLIIIITLYISFAFPLQNKNEKPNNFDASFLN